MGQHIRDRLLSIYNKCIKQGHIYDGDISDINFYNLMSKAGTIDMLESWGKVNVCAYMTTYNDKKSVLIIIGIPINSDKESSTSKSIAEKIMSYVNNAEICFTTLNYNTSKEIKNDNYIYITIVKEVI